MRDYYYAVATDETGQLYISHSVRSRIKNGLKKVKSNIKKAGEGMGRGWRAKTKYLLKIGKGPKAKYAYTKEEVDRLLGRSRKPDTKQVSKKSDSNAFMSRFSQLPVSKIKTGENRFSNFGNLLKKYAKTTLSDISTKVNAFHGQLKQVSRSGMEMLESISEKIKQYTKAEGVPSVLSYLKGDSSYRNIIEKAVLNGVLAKAIHKHEQELSESEIIERIAGGDQTQGSCSSLALTYIANKMGYDVLDFRGGSSTKLFADRNTITDMVSMISKSSPGSAHQSRLASAMDSAKQNLEWAEEGKEYYFAAGCHAAMVKKEGGNLYYLELQSPVSANNGWQVLDDAALTWRFGCYYKDKKNGMLSVLIDSEAFNNKDFISLLGYINTAKGKQRKGGDGRVK